MHDESQVNTMDPLEDVSNPNINDGVRELTSDSEAFPCVLSEEDAVVDPRERCVICVTITMEFCVCNNGMHVVECWGDGSGRRSLGAER
ncbi:hypothetical protein NDU88_001597 [Pleurodeles waltl]|uniref:Uncharacterized protein n=1 Tax=Pleurodeles waltl TaxID=8319 RepID=A0AAV7Q7M1_PLEWA|nr:hypothetical protein NDU88_001597 [Pleurodeles waltl]